MLNKKTSTKNLVNSSGCSNWSGTYFLGKKIFALFLLCLAITPAFAQKPGAGDLAFTFGFNGLSNIGVTSNFGDMGTLLFRYYLADDIALRVRADLLLSTNKTDFSDTSGAGEHDITKSHFINLRGGFQKNFGTSLKHLEPYIAADIMFGLGKLNSTDNTTDFDPTNSVRVEVDPGNTVTFGLIVSAGFHYFFTDHFGAGVEFGYGIQNSHTGEGTTTITNISGATSTTTTSHTATSGSFTLGGFGGEGLIMLTVAFGK